MHIPDNYLSPSTCAVLFAAMIPVWRIAGKKVKEEFTSKKMPLIGICAAFSFLIMMFNVPLPGGTTGHAVGAALAAILLGPHVAVLAITVALAIQALFFGDGGILALGANCFNMAFIMPYSAYYIYKFINKRFHFKQKDIVATFLAGYISLNIAALFTAFQFGIQASLFTDSAGLPLYSPYGLNVAIPAILIPHLLVAGIIEGLVTAAVFSYIKRVSPQVIVEEKEGKLKPLYAIIGTMILLSPLGLLATGTAWGEWGIEEVKSMIGFIPKGMETNLGFNAMIPDYSISGISEILAYLFSATIGITICLLLFLVLSKSIFNRKKQKI